MSEVRTDFDTWFHEQEGASLRSERFNGDVEWLKAAFEAGRSAQPSISTGQANEEVWIERSRANAEAFAAAEEEFFQELAKQPTSEQGEPVAWAIRWSKTGKWFLDTEPVAEINHQHIKDFEQRPLAFADTHPSLPAGHVAVPVEPTEEMLAKAMREADRRGYQHTKGYINEDDARYLYAAMLSALPHNQGEGK